MKLAELVTATGTPVLDHLDRQVEIPVLTGPQIQGDVSILPVTTSRARTPIPAEGIAVVRGENGGHTHSLHGHGFWDASPDSFEVLVLGVLTVPDGSEVFMAHPEHGFSAMAPGTYRIGRQQEYAGQWRVIAD